MIVIGTNYVTIITWLVLNFLSCVINFEKLLRSQVTIFFAQEAERDLSKKWSPVVEMQYRGGRYKGRCQGGLPEGKVNSYKSIIASRAWSS